MTCFFTKKELVNKLIHGANFRTIIDLWNKRVSDLGDWDNEVLKLTEENLWKYLEDPSHLFSFMARIKYGDFDYNNLYFTLNKYGNFFSFNDLEDENCPINLDKLTEWLLDAMNEEDE